VNRIGHAAQVVVRQDDARRRFDVRGEHHVGPAFADGGDDLGEGRRREGRLAAILGRTRLQNSRLRGNLPGIENLRPAVAEPAVPYHQAFLVARELPGDCLHAEGAAAWHDDGRLRLVDALQHAGDVVHDALELLRHVIERAVGVDHGVFKEAVRVNVG
jgi:hypothetical protein